MNKWIWWLKGLLPTWQRQRCDGCGWKVSRFHLDPTSGDWWICPACWDKLHEDMKEVCTPLSHVAFEVLANPIAAAAVKGAPTKCRMCSLPAVEGEMLCELCLQAADFIDG